MKNDNSMCKNQQKKHDNKTEMYSKQKCVQLQANMFIRTKAKCPFCAQLQQ
jgi:hypothetical protein